MARAAKTWDDFSTKYKRELAGGVADTIMSKTATAAEATAFLKQVVERIQRQIGEPLPGLVARENVQGERADVTSEQCHALLGTLGELRQQHSGHNSQLHIAKISVQDLDRAVVSSTIAQQSLSGHGYSIGRAQYRNVSGSSTSGHPATVGRPTKVNDAATVALAGSFLQKYANDSSKVVCVRKCGVKTLVSAKLLSARLWRIYKREEALRAAISFSTFRRIARAHFPHIRKPGRKTDICTHCRVLKRRVGPRASAEYKKRRAQISEHCPNYFHALDSEESFAASTRAGSHDVVLRARRYITQKNNSAEQDPLRRSMSRAARLALFEAEARALHKLGGHCTLLEAYSWHRTTADRQSHSTQQVLEQLADSEAYFHFDFKENVRYPMSREETGEEWHAQNKLSLTVFGCTVYTPGRRNCNFLLVSEVLDHDSQMAKLLLTQILLTVQNRPTFQWEKVQMVHLVCDCGPHFRSGESYAFLLHDLPKQWNVDAASLHSNVYPSPCSSPKRVQVVVFVCVESHRPGDLAFPWGATWQRASGSTVRLGMRLD